MRFDGLLTSIEIPDQLTKAELEAGAIFSKCGYCGCHDFVIVTFEVDMNISKAHFIYCKQCGKLMGRNIPHKVDFCECETAEPYPKDENDFDHYSINVCLTCGKPLQFKEPPVIIHKIECRFCKQLFEFDSSQYHHSDIVNFINLHELREHKEELKLESLKCPICNSLDKCDCKCHYCQKLVDKCVCGEYRDLEE